MIKSFILRPLSGNIGSLRLFDAAVFMAPPVAGLLLAWRHAFIDKVYLPGVLLYLAVIYLMAIHVFLINDLADGIQQKGSLKNNGKENFKMFFSAKQTAVAGLLTAVFSVFLLMLFSLSAFWMGLMLLFLSMIYNTTWIGIHGKGTPFVSSVLHITGGALAFLLGYLYFDAIDGMAVIAALTFGIFLAAGHLVQEIQDWISDYRQNTKTLALWLGKRPVFLLALLLFLISHALIQFLIEKNYFPDITYINISVLLVLFILGFRCYRKLDGRTIFLFRMRYRLLYFIFGLVLLYETFASKLSAV